MNEPNNPVDETAKAASDAAAGAEKAGAEAAAAMPAAAEPVAAPAPAAASGNNDALLGALSYPIAIVGIIVLVSDSMKNRQPLRTHAVQGIVLNVALAIFFIVINLVPIIGQLISCVGIFIWLGITIWYAIQAYQGKDVTIPGVTGLCKKQNWI